MHRFFYSLRAKVQWSLFLLLAVVYAPQAVAQDVVYSETFTNGTSYCPGQSQFDNWGIFRSQLDTTLKKFRQVTVKGSNDPVGITCNDPDLTRKIAHAMRTGTNFSVTCNGQPWVITAGACWGGCSSSAVELELVVGSTFTCNCTNPGYIFRPNIGNLNWGGIGGATCNAPTQTMTVIFSNPLGNNASIGGMSAPVTSCGSATDSISAVVTNQGLNKIGNVPVTCVVTGTLGGSAYSNTFNATLIDSLNPGISKSLKFADINTANGADLNILVYTKYATDTFRTDDTLRIRYKNVGTPTGTVTASDVSRCGTGTMPLSANLPSGTIGYWYNNANRLIGIGNSINSPTIAGGASDSFYVAATKTSAPVTIGFPTNGTNNGGAGFFAGNMFDVSISKTITIDSFDIHLNGTTNRKVVLYMKSGSYIGNQTNPSAWTRVGEYEVTGAGLGNATKLRVKPIEMNPGQYSFYIYASEFLIYTNNNTVGASDDDVTISSGVALRDTFATLQGSARWNGRMYYRQVCVSPTRVKVRTVAKPLAVGGDLTKGTLFKGTFNGGTQGQPDIVAAPDSISYEVMPPTGYSIANYGSQWTIPARGAVTINGVAVPTSLYSFTTPSGSNNAIFRFYPSSAYTDSTVEVSVTLRRLDNGCDTILKRIIFVAPRPVVNYNNTTVCLGSETEFTNTTTVSTGTVEYVWNFGDGTKSIITDPGKTFGGAGTYQVKLVATTNWGIQDSITKTVTIKQIPVADFDFDNACENSPLRFIQNSTIPPGTATYTWNYGDGNTGNGTITTHTFASPGIYNAKLTVDVNGCQNSITRYVTQAPRATPAFTYSPLKCDNANVSFTNNSTGPAFGFMGFEWSFGDGGESTVASPNYTYNTFSAYTVTLYTKTDLGCVDSVKQVITMLESPKPVFNFSTVKCTNDVINFSNNTNVPAGSTNIYEWSFGDGKTSTSATPSHSYDAPDSYTVVLKAISTNGCQGESDQVIAIDEKPKADFVANRVCFGAETEFTNNSTISNGSLTYAWDLGNSTTSASASPKVTYATAQTYNVVLISSSAAGCTDTATMQVIVDPVPAVDVIVASNLTGDGKIKFATSATGVTYQWTFGDGGSSTVQNPTYQYSFPGVWTVRLVVTSPEGCVNSKTTSVNVNPLSVKGAEAMNGLSVYPNPTAGKLTADFSSYSGEEIQSITVTDILGRSVISAAQLVDSKAEIDMSNQPVGVYNLNIQTINSVYTLKIVVNR